jgi:methyltransferase family protein
MGPRPAALKRRVETAIARAAAGESRLAPQALALEGLSSAAERHLLNNLCAPRGVNYLEVGTFKGATLVAASYGNRGRFTAVDNFSEFSHLGGPRETFEEVRAEFERQCRFTFHEADCWSPALRRRLPRGVNVYFYDGRHRYEDQYRAFTHFDPVFADTFIAVVDDWNWENVRRATRHAFRDLGYRVLHERELRTRRWLRDLWWNGLLVAVVRKAAAPRAVKAAPAGRPRGAAAARLRNTRPAAPASARGRKRRTAAPGRSRSDGPSRGARPSARRR